MGASVRAGAPFCVCQIGMLNGWSLSRRRGRHVQPGHVPVVLRARRFERLRFDDRLATVLRLNAQGVHERAVQWRQLVELIARGAARNSPGLQEEALGLVATLMRDVPDHVRAAAARAIAGPGVPAELVALFAADSLEVAAPVLTAAELDAAGWAAVRVVASEPVAAMLSALRPEPEAAQKQPKPQPTPVFVEPLVSTAMDAPYQVPSAPAPPPSPGPTVTGSNASSPPSGVFRWECGPTGEIDWVEGAPRAALIGCSLADELDRRFDDRLPFEDEPLRLADEGVLAGEWRWTGTPTFFADTGRFAGYRGTARREGAVTTGAAASAVSLDSDSLRELVHELRTPLNAIIGFGEMIDGQYLGPAHRVYRDRAGTIVRQARQLVEAVEDLDFSARLQSGRGEPPERVSFDSVFSPFRTTILEQAASSDVTLTISIRGLDDRSIVDRDTSLRLLQRFLSSVIAAAAPGERLELIVDRLGEHLAVAVDRPESVRGVSEDQLLDPAFHMPSNAGPGLGFALRLVRGLASMAGGGLDIAPERLVLLLPVSAG